MEAVEREGSVVGAPGAGRMLTLDGASPPPRRGKMMRAASFIRPWAFGAASAAYLFGGGWWKWKNRAAIVELCRHFGYSYDTREPAELPLVETSQIVPASSLLDVREMDAVDGNVSERELVTIARLVRAISPLASFEFGTFDGRTTLNIASNSPAGARVYTLDLPQESIAASAAPIHAHEVRYADKPQSGLRFRESDLAGRIEQLHGDSGTFDLRPYYDGMDFIFIDGSHAYEYVVNDSLHAIRMLRLGKGIILWHDYSRWDGVTRALNELRRLDSRFAGLSWIGGTTLALLRC